MKIGGLCMTKRVLKHKSIPIYYVEDEWPRYAWTVGSQVYIRWREDGKEYVQFSLSYPKTLYYVIQLQVDLPLVDGSYKWADGKSVGVYDSTVVAIHTDHPDGIVG